MCYTILNTSFGIGDFRDIEIINFWSEFMVESKYFGFSKPFIFFLPLFEFLKFKMSRETFDLYIFRCYSCWIFIKNMWLKGAVLKHLIFSFSPLMSNPLLFFFQLFLELSRIVLRSRAIWHCVVWWNILVFPVFRGLWTESAIAKLLSHELLLYLFSLHLTFRIIG